MAVSYRPIDGESVSAQWFVVLQAMRADGVHGNVNEGHRTLARQAYFYNGWIRRLPGFNLAAFPSPFAPHIRTGRIDHAIDFGNDSEVFAWLQRHGLHPARTVRGESWHIECPADALRHFAATHGDPLLGLHRAERKLADKVIHHRRAARHSKGSKRQRNLAWMRWWKLALRAQMRAIQAAARRSKGGWKRHNRAKRYQILGAVLEAKGAFR